MEKVINTVNLGIDEKYINAEYADLAAVTTKTREENNGRVVIGSVRLGSGRYRTEREKKRFVKKAWKKRLP